MSRRRELAYHRHSLGEIRGIMNSMKTLAYMETRKLGRFLPAQQAVLKAINTMAADFLHFHPDLLPEAEESRPVVLIIGTERGFCGDFNQALLEELDALSQSHGLRQAQLIALGHKLHSLLEGDARVTAYIDGASVAEEVHSVLQRVVETLGRLRTGGSHASLYGLFHGDTGIVLQPLLPPFRLPGPAPGHRHPPLLNLTAEQFLLDLSDHYLFAAIHQMFYSSLMEENRRRVAHLESAVHHLDEKASELTRQYNALRQEEIIEEIEVILLSAASTDGDPSLSL